MSDSDFVIDFESESEKEELDTKIRYWWGPGSCRGPFCREVIEITESSITFDGYFYDSEKEQLPQQRILKLLVPDYVEGHRTYLKRLAIYHVEIYEKIEGADTSVFAADDGDGEGGICFFPSAKITLKFRVLQKDFDDAEEKRILATFPLR
jgi:hypothetical protein